MANTVTPNQRAAGRTTIERRAALIRRAWTKAERNVVWQGFLGRFSIALEPVICGSVFAALTVGLIARGELFLAPIFALGLVGFAIYAVWLLNGPARALLATRKPIYIVDGYIRYRGRDNASPDRSRGYVAVLCDRRHLIGEWPLEGPGLVLDIIRPAMIEFSDFGGIHRIDGHSTGAIPDRVPTFGVGVPR